MSEQILTKFHLVSHATRGFVSSSIKFQESNEFMPEVLLTLGGDLSFPNTFLSSSMLYMSLAKPNAN